MAKVKAKISNRSEARKQLDEAKDFIKELETNYKENRRSSIVVKSFPKLDCSFINVSTMNNQYEGTIGEPWKVSENVGVQIKEKSLEESKETIAEINSLNDPAATLSETQNFD